MEHLVIQEIVKEGALQVSHVSTHSDPTDLHTCDRILSRLGSLTRSWVQDSEDQLGESLETAEDDQHDLCLGGVG